MTVNDQAARARAEKVEALLTELTAEEKANLVSGWASTLISRNPKRMKPSWCGWLHLSYP